MRDFEQLMVWERSHRLTLAVYKATVTLPREELYGLTSQMRRSCAAIPANIAEGCGRSTNADPVRFLQIAPGYASEPEYHLQLPNELDLLNSREYNRLMRQVTEVKRMLTSATRLKQYFAQPMHASADYTGVPATWVDPEEGEQELRRLLDATPAG